MRKGSTIWYLAAVLVLAPTLCGELQAQESFVCDAEVLVTAGLDPLAGASVALDLNSNGVWDADLNEPIAWTDSAGMASFASVVSIENPGDRAPEVRDDWQPTRIMMGNLRGTVGSPEVRVDFVLPAGTGPACLGLYELRGRRIAQTSGVGDLSLTAPSGLPAGVYFLRLSADSVAPVSQRFTSIGVRTRTIRATRVSAADALSAGWAGDRPVDDQKRREEKDPPEIINLIVAHDEYPTVVQPEVIEPEYNEFTVNMLPGSVVVEPGGGGEIVIDDPQDPLDGVVVTIPEGAVEETTLFGVAYVGDPPPTDFPGLTPLGLAVEVTSSHDGGFDVPIEITIPVPDDLEPELVPVGTYFDEELDDWRPVPFRNAEDGSAVIIATDHLSVFSVHQIQITADMTEAMTGLSGLVGLLRAAHDEVNGGMGCATLHGLRSTMQARADDDAADLSEFDDAHTWCVENPCDGIVESYDSFGAWAVDFVSEQIADETPARILEWVDSALSGGPESLVLFAVGLVVLGPCAFCALVTSNVAPWVLSAWFGFTLSTTGVTMIDQAVDESGCNDETPIPGFVYVPPGAFHMGSPLDEPGRDANETLHTVTLTQGFYISTYEVTEEWWDDVMGSGSSTSQLPENRVSWDAAVEFCNQLSIDEGLTPAYEIHGPDGNVTWNRDADGYRLPTEAEWEYACRAGSQAAFCNGLITNIACSPLDPKLDEVGWYCGNASSRHEVGQKAPSSWGLHDMHGNLLEWVWDGYRDDYQDLSPVDPVHDVGTGFFRVVRGGFWLNDARNCRSAYRSGVFPDQVSSFVGFRPVRSAF